MLKGIVLRQPIGAARHSVGAPPLPCGESGATDSGAVPPYCGTGCLSPCKDAKSQGSQRQILRDPCPLVRSFHGIQ